ncbi:hypothetical protein B0T25DRAFT_599397 [Lasiosphaeria hispida]|uniref:Uncharacterized protein n=1 Tax=Lasiosphaeria hispida TaxID=260671 RepID=A0AAJ0M7J2_9PEZI|nr:hypothetical protein B0T25DRAFT_599397 [Lasiosphaeria hispida]
MDDDIQDPCWSWPHWKFGLKRSDLFTKLHDQYNTVPSAIQDPEAFHHDDRKEQRLRELNNSLESAAFEIIANPSLIGTEQWQHAVQLFRTKSLDSLVRYFASYLPQDHPWHRSTESSSVSETSSTVDSLTNSHGSYFGDHDDEPIMTDEPLELTATFEGLLPPSPRSMTMCSDSSAACHIDMAHHKYDLNTLTPPRTLSYSDSEPDLHDDDASQPPSAHPRPVFFETKPSLPHRRHRSLSPSRPLPLTRCEVGVLASHCDPRSLTPSTRPSRPRRVEDMAAVRRSRRNRGEPATCIRKTSPDAARSRPRGRRRGEC